MDNNTLNGFEVFDDILPGAINRKPKVQEVEDIAGEELTEDELDKIKNQGKPTEEEPDKPTEEEVIEEPKQTKTKQKETKQAEETEEDDDTVDDNISSTDDQTSLVTSFFDTISEQFGWDDVEEDEKPKTAEELVQYFRDVIEENSKPEYASKEMEDLDNYVRNGGDLKKYLKIDAELDITDIDIEDEVNQKAVLKEFLKEKGYSDKQITKKLDKYEDAGILEDEAQDALEALRDIREQKKAQLLVNQEKAAREAYKQQQDYFNSVVAELKGMQDIRGIKVPEKDKRLLLEYIFRADADGKTQYQKDWSKSVRNLLESAYFTMKGDTLLKSAKIEGSNEAINKFKSSLNKTGVSRKTKKVDDTTSDDMWKSFISRLRA